MIKRHYDLNKMLESGKAVIIYGPRQVGKTTLLHDWLSKTKLKCKLDLGENIATQDILSSQNFDRILEYVEGYDVFAIDEAQHVPAIGLAIKILVDQKPDLKIIATGSSSFDLAHNVGEPLTGRKKTIILYPIAQLELLSIFNKAELKHKQDEFLIYGAYPEVVTAKNKGRKVEILMELANSYLLRDILALERVKALAFS